MSEQMDVQNSISQSRRLYRARLRFRVHKKLNIADGEEDVNNRRSGRCSLRAGGHQTHHRRCEWLVLSTSGFSSEAEARKFGHKLRAALEVSSIANRLGVDPGRDCRRQAWVRLSARQIFPDDLNTAIFAVHGVRWVQMAQIETALIDPGKPWQNGADESFNGKFRDQHLSLQSFRNRTDAKVSIEQWRRHYNEVRPHSSLKYLTPVAFKAKHLADVDGGHSPALPARAEMTKNEERLTGPISAVLQ